jgi:hypothetical protein
MTDLVERLRSFHHTNSVYGAAQDAADRIEALEVALEDAIDTLESMDLHINNPLYERLCAALDKDAGE